MEQPPENRYSVVRIEELLASLPGWRYNASKGAIERQFVRKNFVDAVHFIQQIAERAEEQDHHPDLFLFGYKNVLVTLSTHSASGVTRNDFDLARAIDKLND